MVVHDRGQPTEFVESDGLGIILGRAARDVTHRVDMQNRTVDLGRHDVAAVPCADEFGCGDGCLDAQCLHPRQLRLDRGQGVVAGPMNSQDHRLVALDEIRGVLRQTQQPQR